MKDAKKKVKLERRGGRRPGSGRKPKWAKKLGIKPTSAAILLACVDEMELARSLLHDKSADVRLRTWITLREEVFGKPKQQIGLAGAMAVARVHQEVSDEDLDAQIKAVTEPLGLTPKTLAAHQKARTILFIMSRNRQSHLHRSRHRQRLSPETSPQWQTHTRTTAISTAVSRRSRYMTSAQYARASGNRIRQPTSSD
jgi:hypothetical protein